MTKRVLPAGRVRLQRALAAEARSYSTKIGELDQRSRGPRGSQAVGDGDPRGEDAEPDNDGD